MFCVNCGKEIRDGSKFCPYCGAKDEAGIPAQGAAPQVETKSAREVKKELKAQQKAEKEAAREERRQEKLAESQAFAKSPGGIIGSVILSVLLGIMSLTVMPLLVIKRYGDVVEYYFGGTAQRLMCSAIPILFAAVIVLMLAVDLFIVNRRRVRRGFLCCGIAFAAAGVCSVALGVFMPLLAAHYEALAVMQNAICVTEMFFGLCIFVFGVLWMSIYACIGAMKKEGGKAA